MNRTICHRTVRRGSFRGAFAVTVRFGELIDGVALTAKLETLLQNDAVAGGEIWSAVDARDQPVSMEEKLRGGDRKIRGCLMVDTLRFGDAERLGEQLSQAYPDADVGVFRVLCQLGRGDL